MQKHRKTASASPRCFCICFLDNGGAVCYNPDKKNSGRTGEKEKKYDHH